MNINFAKDKKRILIWICVICILLACTVIYQKETYRIGKGIVSVTEESYHPANSRQYISSVRMHVWEDTLFFYHWGGSNNSKTQYYQELCAFVDGKVESFGRISMLYAANGGYIYYDGEKPYGRFSLRSFYFDPFASIEIRCLNLATKESKQLALVSSFDLAKIYYDPSGVCYFPDDDNPGNFFVLRDDTISESLPLSERYTLGDYQYAIEEHDLVRYNEQGDREILKEFIGLGSTCIIPCDFGLLVYVEGGANLLYYIPEESESVEPLFTFDGFASDSAVNVHGEWVYVSFGRYESLDGCGLTKFENDTMEGTYRINLADRSVEKLSDVIYDGLYIFDDTGIYACNDGCIYKLDFDGNVIMELLY